MPRIIKNARIVDDGWQVFRLAEGEQVETVALPEGPALLPLALWQARRAEIAARGTPIGLWLDVTDDPASIATDLPHFALLAVNFPKFTDGRGYSTARLLRERYGYRGELRAIGDVLHDQLFYMRRCGIDAFAVREDKDIEKALAGLATFGESYQAATDQPLPLFRRRAAPKTQDASRGAP